MRNELVKAIFLTAERVVELSEESSFSRQEDLIEAGQYLRAICLQLAKVDCPSCKGAGRRNFSSTLTWRGGGGGRAMTPDICDWCWGTGRNDKTGVDLRAIWLREQVSKKPCGCDGTPVSACERCGHTWDDVRADE